MNSRIYLMLFLVVLSTNLAICENFLYFAYGSNLLSKRIHINNPSAVLEGVGKLENHRLDFIKFTSFWNGSVATIVEDTNEDIWGALWALDKQHMKSLDRQESVDSGWYFAKTVNITKIDGSVVEARTYEQTVKPIKIEVGEKVPYDRRPSRTYLKVIVDGAIECGLPSEYIRKLKKISSNHKVGSLRVLASLGPGY